MLPEGLERVLRAKDVKDLRLACRARGLNPAGGLFPPCAPHVAKWMKWMNMCVCAKPQSLQGGGQGVRAATPTAPVSLWSAGGQGVRMHAHKAADGEHLPAPHTCVCPPSGGKDQLADRIKGDMLNTNNFVIDTGEGSGMDGLPVVAPQGYEQYTPGGGGRSEACGRHTQLAACWAAQGITLRTRRAFSPVLTATCGRHRLTALLAAP